MKKIDWKKVLPHILAIGVFLIVTIIYCHPVLQGNILEQHDNIAWKGMAQQSFEFKEKHGHFPLWTNSMFSGMPAYQIAVDQRHSLSMQYFSYLFTFGLPKPMDFFFSACICFYLLMLILKIRPSIGVFAALCYAYATYNPIIVAAGHDTKMQAIAYAPAIIGAIILIFNKKYWLGSILLTISYSLQIGTNHLQIVYYTLLTAFIIAVFYIIEYVKQNNIKHIISSIAICVLIGIVSLGSNAITMLTTYEYTRESMRGGKTELQKETTRNNTKDGLDKDYAFRWSYGLLETFSLVVPGIYGGSNGGNEYSKSQFADKLTEVGYNEEAALNVANGSSYWGTQPMTSGPVYYGAIICFLFIVGLFLVKTTHRWWLLTASIVGIILAWGKNFETVNYFLFDYLPFYKKFRTPSMSLVMPQLCFPVLAAIALNQIINFPSAENWKRFKKAGIAILGVLIILCACYISFSYSGPNDKALQENFSNAMLQQAGNQSAATVQQAQEFGRSFVTALQTDRKSLFGKDLLQAFLWIGLVFILIYAYLKKKIQAVYLLAGVTIFSLIDLFSIATKYLNSSKYVPADEYQQAFTMNAADATIKKDTGYFRVFNQTVDPFNDASTSYFHNSAGGYHPAKLGLYQDLIDQQLSKGNMQVYNMLNTRYFITPDNQTNQPVAQLNPGAFGPCWFVKGVKYVRNGTEEMNALSNTNLKDTAIVQEKFKSVLQLPEADSTASLQLIANNNDSIFYTYSATTKQLVVFSEIYYPLGWNAYLDGKKVEHAKANYLLRAMNLPAGKHSLVFRFEPGSFYLGNKLSFWSCILLYLLILTGLFIFFKQYRRETSTQADD